MTELLCAIEKSSSDSKVGEKNSSDSKVGEKNSSDFTVGETFAIKCTGSLPDLKLEKTDLKLDESEKYVLKILKIEKPNSSELKLLATSYRVGEHKLKSAQLADGDQSVSLSGLQFSVKSVIEQKQGEPVQPFGPLGPIRQSFPILYIVIPLILIILFLSLFIQNLLKKNKKKALYKNREEHHVAATAIDQLYKNIRRIEKIINEEDSQNFLEQILNAYLIFIARTFEIPALDISEKELLKDIKKQNKKMSFLIKKTLEELNHSRSKKLVVSQKIDLIKMIRISSETILKEIDEAKI